MSRLIKLTVIWLALACASAWGAPSISGVSGTVSHGQSITITGAGFGTKTTAAPLVWDDFESGTVDEPVEGESPVIGSNWSIGASLGNPVYSTSVVRVGSSKSVSIPFGPSMYRNYLSIRSDSDEYYFSFWARFSSQEDGDRNWKPYYIYPPAITDLVPSQALGIWGPSGGGWRVSAASQDHTADGCWGPGDLLDDIEDLWIRYEVYIKQSSPNQEDGATMISLHYDSSTKVIKSFGNSAMKTRSGALAYGTINIGVYYGSGGQNATVYLDDVYFDTTQARVEVGNNAIWASCTRREIQIPTAWAAGEITITVNQSSFSTGTAYLFVVDADGVVSDGYEITLGSSAGGGGWSASGTMSIH